MLRNTLFSKAVCIATIYAFTSAILPKPAHAVRGLAPISFDEMYSLAQNGQVEALRASVYRGLNIDTVNSDGDTGLCIAARRHDVYTYNSFRAAGAEPRHPCTQKISDYNDFLEKSNVVGLGGTSREALSAMGNKETYKFGATKWWLLGGLLAAGGITWWALSHHHHKKSGSGGGSGGGGGGGDIPAAYYSLGANAYSEGKAIKETHGDAANTSSLSYSNDSLKNLDSIDLRQNVLKNTSKIKSILFAGNGGSYTNNEDITLETGNGTIAMNALNKSAVKNSGYINITGSNAGLGMVASVDSAAFNDGSGIANKSSSPNGININFSGYKENATVVGMYADTNSQITNNGDIVGKAIQSAQSSANSDSNQTVDHLSDGVGNSSSQTSTSQETSAKGTMIGMEAMILNVGASLHKNTIKVNNNGKISLSAGDNGNTSASDDDSLNVIHVSLIGMGSFLDDAFLNKSNILSRAENAELNNNENGSIYLEYSGNYSASSETALRKGLGGIVGMRADANSKANNAGNIDIVLHDEFESEGIDVAAGMQSVHGGDLYNSGNIKIFTPSKNYRVNYGMMAVEGSGTNSGLYADLNPTLKNTGEISIQISNSYGMASFVGGTVINDKNGRIIVGSNDKNTNETYYNKNIAMYGYGNTKKTALENYGTIDLYSHQSIAMQNDYPGGTDITNNGTINIYESSVDSYVFGGKYSNLYNKGDINYYATSSQQEGQAGAGKIYNPFANYIVSIGISAVSTKTRSIKTGSIDYSSSTTEAIYNDNVINLIGSSFVSAMSVETNDNAQNTQAKAYNRGTINIKDRDTKNATNAVGMYVDSHSLNNAGIYNEGTINTDSSFSAAMASDSKKNADVINRGEITTNKANSLGIFISDVSNVRNYNKININGSNSVGIQAGMNNETAASADKGIYPHITNDANDEGFGVITVGNTDNFVENSYGIYIDVGGTEDRMSAQIENLGEIYVYTQNAGAGIYSNGYEVKIDNKNLIHIFGNNAYGIYSGNMANIINNKTINVGTEEEKVSNSYAIYNTGSGTIVNNDTINYYSDGESFGYAVYSSGNADIINNRDINLYNERSIAISAKDGSVTNNSPKVVLSYDYNTYVELTGNASMINNKIIDVGSEDNPIANSAGIRTTETSTSEITNNNIINLYNKSSEKSSHAIVADGNVKITNSDIAQINSYKDDSDVIYVTGTASVINDGNITVNGSRVYAIKGYGENSIINLNNNGIITVGTASIPPTGGSEGSPAGENGAAVYAPTINNIINNGTITVYNTSGYGIYAENGTQDGSIANYKNINILEENGTGIYSGMVTNVSNSGNIEMGGENSKGIDAFVGDTTINNSGTINITHGKNGYGIYSNGASNISNTSTGSIIIGADSSSINPTKGHGIYAPFSSSISNYGRIEVHTADGGAISGNGTITNYGSISTYNTNNFGINSSYSTNVINTGSIDVADGYGISTLGTVANTVGGVIKTPKGIGVQNASSLDNSGIIEANSDVAAVFNVDAITNRVNASISNHAPDGTAGSAIAEASNLTNHGTISSDNSALQKVKQVDNYGVIESTKSYAMKDIDALTLYSGGSIVSSSNVATVVNAGTVTINSGSSIINNCTDYSSTGEALGYGIKNVENVINYGTISSHGDAIHYDGGSTFTVDNYGTIQITGSSDNSGSGIKADLGAHPSAQVIINNHSQGQILGGHYGIEVLNIPSHETNVTITNEGYIQNGIHVTKLYHFTQSTDEQGKVTYNPSSENTKIIPGSASVCISCTGHSGCCGANEFPCSLPEQTEEQNSGSGSSGGGASGASVGEVVEPVYADSTALSSSLIYSEDPDILRTVNLVNRGTINTGGDVDFGSQDENSAQISIGNGGSYQADSFTGTISAEADIVEDGFETTYVNKDSFIGKDNGINVLSKSYMFDAATAENEDGNTDIVMTLKPFAETTENSDVSAFLSQSYENQEGEQLFETLKTAADRQQFNNYINKELGLDIIPNFIKQSMEVERSVATETTDNLLDLDNTGHRRFAEMMLYRNNVKDKGATAGYKDNVIAAHGFMDSEMQNHLRSGFGLSVIRADSKYNNDSSRYNNTADVFVPVIFDKDGLAALVKPKVGLSRGHYRRDGVNNTHKADSKEYFWGIDTAVKKDIRFGSVDFEPTAGFNVMQLYSDDMHETNNGLKIKDEKTFSAYSVLGLKIKKKFALNQISDISLSAAAKYFHEFGEKYENHARLADSSNYYKIESNRFERDYGLLKFQLQYNLENAGFGAAVILPIEKQHRPYYMLNAKYSF